jgi:hypothetical protein
MTITFPKEHIMAFYYNNDARLLMDIKPNAVPFACEDIIVPILTAMTPPTSGSHA